MPAKLVLSLDGKVLNEYPLNKERITIGRRPYNDIVINNLAVSGEHAAVITILNDSFFEDLNSTNGSLVNGVPTTKHFLQNNDVIEIGKYKLKYLNDQPSQMTAEEFEKTMLLRMPAKPPVPSAERHNAMPQFNATTTRIENVPVTSVPQPAATTTPVAMIQILNGPKIGKELELTKKLTTLGKPGVQVAVLARRPRGYFITHVEGRSYPLVNGISIGEQPHQLSDHDVIELAGIKMEFYYKA